MTTTLRLDEHRAGVWLTRYLEQRLPGVIRKKFPGLPFDTGELLPQTGDLAPGAATVVAELVNEVGQADEGLANADDIPLVDVTVSEDKYKVIAIPVGFKYGVRELEASEMASRNNQSITNLPGERMTAATRAIAQKSHKLGAFGSNRHGMYGLLNNPDVPVTDSSVNLYDSTQANYERIVLDFFGDTITSMRDNSNLVESPNVILLRDKLYRKLTTHYRSSNSDQNLLEAILKSNPEVRAIRPINEARSADLETNGVHPGGTNKDRILFYNLAPENVQRKYEPIQRLAPQLRGLTYYVYMYKCVSSVMFHYPQSARYVQHPTAA